MALAKNSVSVVYASFSPRDKRKIIRRRQATIDASHVAHICLPNFTDTIKRKPGEYLLTDCFENEWRAAVKAQAEDMAQRVLQSKGGAGNS